MPRFLAGLVAGALAVCAGYALASRNSSGTMSAVNGPYVPGTTISSSQINARYSDIENEITDSLDRSGKGGMLASLRGIDGTVAAPAYSWTNDTATGWYRIGAGDYGFSLLGTKALEVHASGFGFPSIATPGSPVNGDGWYDTTQNIHVLRSNSVSYSADAFVVAGNVTGASGTVSTQRGTVTASVSHTGTGAYTLTVSGMTGAAIVTCTPKTGASACIVNPGTGSAVVNTFTTNTAAAADINWSFVVTSL